MKTICCLTLLLAFLDLSAGEVKPLEKLKPDELVERLTGDLRTIQLHRAGLQAVSAYMASQPDLFPTSAPKTSRLLRREEKEKVWNTWQRFLDYELALESLEQYYTGFNHLKGAAKEDSFLIGYAAMLARYRAALEFITHADKNPELDKVLNDPVPELGLPSGTYARLKLKHLNLAIATQFAARETLLKTFSGGRQPALREAIKSDADYIWKMGQGGGELMTAKNALKVVQNGAQTIWLPIQTGVSEWMGHTKVYRPKESLVSPAQIRELQPMLQPGDVLLERREWYLSNIGLPGFWSHAALYIGTAEERHAFFDDAGTRAWVKAQGEPTGDLEPLLKAKCERSGASSLYPLCTQPQEEGHLIRILEAIGEGVSFKTLEHSANCDSLVVLRPRLSKAERALALARAFHYAGRPYDFNFDFATDAELVCTELVYKAYEPSAGCSGLTFPLVEMLGRKVTPANELAKQFDAQYDTAGQQFDMVVFLDGHEKQKQAAKGSVADFRETWRRPKWHVFVQK